MNRRLNRPNQPNLQRSAEKLRRLHDDGTQRNTHGQSLPGRSLHRQGWRVIEAMRSLPSRVIADTLTAAGLDEELQPITGLDDLVPPVDAPAE